MIIKIRTKQAVDLLKRNAEDFLNEGITIILNQRATVPQAKLAVVAIQTAAELLAKLAIVKTHGLRSIIIQPPQDLEAHLNRNGIDFTTLGYSQTLKFLVENDLLSRQDRETFKEIQILRNSLAHFGSSVEVSDVRTSVCWLLVRVLAVLAAGVDRDQAEFQSHRSFLTESNFYDLIDEQAFREEAVDAANEAFETENVYTCWNCRNTSMAQRVSEAYFCWCCGLTADSTAVAYTDCKLCDTENGVYYDRLNGNNGKYFGKCTACDEKVEFKWCRSCGTNHMNLMHPPETA